MVVSSAEGSSADSFRYGELNGITDIQTFDRLGYYLRQNKEIEPFLQSKSYVKRLIFISSRLIFESIISFQIGRINGKQFITNVGKN